MTTATYLTRFDSSYGRNVWAEVRSEEAYKSISKVHLLPAVVQTLDTQV